MRPKKIVLRSILCAAMISIVAAPGLQPLSAQTTPAPDWKTFTYPADGFRISFPAAPSEDRQSIDTAAGKLQLRTYQVELSQVALFIAVTDFGSTAANGDIDALLQGAKDGALQNSGAHLTGETKITLGTYPGIQFEAATDSAHFYARIYLVGTMLYQTLVIVPSGTRYPETNRFLDSFQLIARTQS